MIGTPLTLLPELSEVEFPKQDLVPRLRATGAGREELEAMCSENPTWDQARRIQADILAEVLSVSELVAVWAAGQTLCDLDRWVVREYYLLRKVQHTWFHFGRPVHITYAGVVRVVAALRSLAWSPFDLTLAAVSEYSADGPAEGVRPGLWLDNDFGLLVHERGVHVLTVGFGVGDRGVYVSQVQLAKKRGNRFLFHLGAHYLDAALEVLARAFGTVWLVEGDSAVAGLRRSYGRNYGTDACGLTPESEARIAALYDRPLATYDRSDESDTRERRTYRRLVSKQSERSAT